MDKLKMETQDLTTENIDKIGELFPNCITEKRDENGKLHHAVNFEMLKQMLSSEVLEGDEAYDFTWVGKKASIVETNRPIRKTLRPCQEESKDWDTTENLYIEGDNLDALKLLQESYLNKVKMIYIDPPYNTGHDFIYNDHFEMDKQDYNEQINLFDEDENKNFSENSDSNPRFHSDWCSMIYPRLALARNVLTEDGVIFISIDDHEVDNLRKCCNEVFGEDNFIAELIWQKRKGGGNDTYFIGVDHEYILVYSKEITGQKCSWRVPYDTEYLKRYNCEDEIGKFYYDTLSRPGLKNPIIYDVLCPDGTVIKNGTWQISKETFDIGIKTGEVKFINSKNGGYTVVRKVRQPEGRVFRSILTQTTNADSAKNMQDIFENKKMFSSPKPVKLIYELEQLCLKDNDIILDFFSGSATTANAVMRLNAEDGGHRKFIMVQLPEPCDEKSEAYKAGYKNICEIGKERIRRAGDKIKSDSPLTTKDLDIGFRVLKLDETNMKDVYYSADEYDQRMLAKLASNIKDDRTDLDLLFGCLLDWGLPLSMPYTSEIINGCRVLIYNNGDLIACFSKDVPESVVRKIAKRRPLRVVFQDSSFADSPEKINVTEIFKLLAPNTTVKVI